MGVPCHRLHSGERRNPYLDTSPGCPLDKGGQTGLDRGLGLQAIDGLPREVGRTSDLDLFGNHVSSRRLPGWWPRASGGDPRCSH